MHIRSISACAIFAVAAFSPNVASAAPVNSNVERSTPSVRGIRLREREPTSELVGVTAPGGTHTLPRAYAALEDPYSQAWDEDGGNDEDDDGDEDGDEDDADPEGPAAALMRRNLRDYGFGIAEVPPVTPVRRNIDQLIKARK